MCTLRKLRSHWDIIVCRGSEEVSACQHQTIEREEMSKQYDVQRQNTASNDNPENSVENFRDVLKQNMVLTMKLLQHYYPLVVTNFCPPRPPPQRSCPKNLDSTHLQPLNGI